LAGWQRHITTQKEGACETDENRGDSRHCHAHVERTVCLFHNGGGDGGHRYSPVELRT
jgi:hypothetical protein